MKDLNEFYCNAYYGFTTVVSQESTQISSSQDTARAEQTVKLKIVKSFREDCSHALGLGVPAASAAQDSSREFCFCRVCTNSPNLRGHSEAV